MDLFPHTLRWNSKCLPPHIGQQNKYQIASFLSENTLKSLNQFFPLASQQSKSNQQFPVLKWHKHMSFCLSYLCLTLFKDHEDEGTSYFLDFNYSHISCVAHPKSIAFHVGLLWEGKKYQIFTVDKEKNLKLVQSTFSFTSEIKCVDISPSGLLLVHCLDKTSFLCDICSENYFSELKMTGKSQKTWNQDYWNQIKSNSTFATELVKNAKFPSSPSFEPNHIYSTHFGPKEHLYYCTTLSSDFHIDIWLVNMVNNTIQHLSRCLLNKSHPNCVFYPFKDNHLNHIYCIVTPVYLILYDYRNPTVPLVTCPHSIDYSCLNQVCAFYGSQNVVFLCIILGEPFGSQYLPRIALYFTLYPQWSNMQLPLSQFSPVPFRQSTVDLNNLWFDKQDPLNPNNLFSGSLHEIELDPQSNNHGSKFQSEIRPSNPKTFENQKNYSNFQSQLFAEIDGIQEDFSSRFVFKNQQETANQINISSNKEPLDVFSFTHKNQPPRLVFGDSHAKSVVFGASWFQSQSFLGFMGISVSGHLFSILLTPQGDLSWKSLYETLSSSRDLSVQHVESEINNKSNLSLSDNGENKSSHRFHLRSKPLKWNAHTPQDVSTIHLVPTTIKNLEYFPNAVMPNNWNRMFDVQYDSNYVLDIQPISIDDDDDGKQSNKSRIASTQTNLQTSKGSQSSQSSQTSQHIRTPKRPNPALPSTPSSPRLLTPKIQVSPKKKKKKKIIKKKRKKQSGFG